jgi:predicted  nucleic acid-binding Zn-ribbon protein
VLHQLAHKRANLPQKALLSAAQEDAQHLVEELEIAKSAESDIRRELTRLEDEIVKVEARSARDKERLESGGGQSRELIALQQELETLARRRASLEDDALEVMERLESARETVVGLAESGRLADLRVSDLEQELAGASAELDSAASGEQARRAAAAAGLDDGLVKLYERLRGRLAGVGAAALVGGRCQGCGMVLSASDLAAIAALAEDDVARCEECGRILVRAVNAA